MTFSSRWLHWYPSLHWTRKGWGNSGTFSWVSYDSEISPLADESFKWTDFLKQWDVRSSGGIWLCESHAEVKRHCLKQEALNLILIVHLIPQRQPLQYYSIVSHALLLNYMPIGKSTSIKTGFSRSMLLTDLKKKGFWVLEEFLCLKQDEELLFRKFQSWSHFL